MLGETTSLSLRGCDALSPDHAAIAVGGLNVAIADRSNDSSLTSWRGDVAPRSKPSRGLANVFVVATLLAFAFATPTLAQTDEETVASGSVVSSSSEGTDSASQANAIINQNSGKIEGNERFMRRNRRRGDFVGADRYERRSFVGSQLGQTSGRAIQSTLGLRPSQDRSSQINQPLPRPARNQVYYF